MLIATTKKQQTIYCDSNILSDFVAHINKQKETQTKGEKLGTI